MDASPFQKLSPELRNTIWALVVTSETPLTFNKPATCSPPPITATCRQIRAESLQMFYSCKVFGLHLPEPSDDNKTRALKDKALAWAASISRECHDLIARFEVHSTDESFMQIFMLEASMLLKSHPQPLGLAQALSRSGYVGKDRYLWVHTYSLNDANDLRFVSDIVASRIGGEEEIALEIRRVAKD